MSAILVLPLWGVIIWFLVRLCLAATSPRYGRHDKARYVAEFLVAALLAVLLFIVWDIARYGRF